MMHKLAIRLTDTLIRNQVAERGMEEYYTYGLEIVMEKIISYTILLLLSLYFNLFVPTLLFLICFFTLRSRTGGFHAPNYLTCFLSTIILYIVTAKILVPFFESHLFLLFAVLGAMSLVIYFLAPVNHPNLDLESEEVVACRRSSRLILLIQLICIVSVYLLGLNTACIVFPSLGIIMCAVLICIAKIIHQEVEEVKE